MYSWEVPFNHPNRIIPDESRLELSRSVSAEFGLIAKFENEIILKTDIGPLLFENQYMQISTLLPDGYDVYGFGETERDSFKLDTKERKRHTIWSAGQPVKRDANLYG